MQKYLISVAIVLITLITSCKKHDGSYKENFPTTYYSTEWHAGPVKLFSKNGEITDANIIASFIDRRDAAKELYFGTQVIDSFAYRIMMYTPDSVTFNMEGVPYKCRLNESGNFRSLQYRDTISTYANNTYEGAMYLLQIRNGFSQYPPLYEEVSHDVFPRYRVKPLFPMQRTADGMEVKFINSVLCVPNWHPTVQFYVNVFSGKGNGALAESDTLLIQERTLIMKKRN